MFLACRKNEDDRDKDRADEQNDCINEGTCDMTSRAVKLKEGDPCESVKTQFEGFKNKIKNLRNALNQNNEKGYAESTENTFPPLPPSGNNNLVLPTNPHIFAYMHIHPNELSYKIFSPADFNIFHKLIVQAQFSSIGINGEMGIKAVYGIVIANDEDKNGNTVQSNYMLNIYWGLFGYSLKTTTIK